MEPRKRLKDYWSDAVQDVRYTFRTLGRDPGFATVSILILALAIGANIAVFSVVNTLLLRPLPFPDSQQLVWIAPPPTDVRPLLRHLLRRRIRRIPRSEPRLSGRDRILGLQHSRQSAPHRPR